jgi:hypothetical protein
MYIIIFLFILLFIIVVWYFLSNDTEYGTIKGWYSSKRSQYLNDKPIAEYYNQMNKNLKKSNEYWKIMHIPREEELPNYGPWWHWPTELENINKVIDYLGKTLGRFETHIGAVSSFADKLRWKPNSYPNYLNMPFFEINNNSLSSAISNSSTPDNIVFTQQQWDSFNVTSYVTISNNTNVITPLHYINVGNKQYRPVSTVMDRLNNEAAEIIKRDINNDPYQFVAMFSIVDPFTIALQGDTRTIDNNLKIEDCGGICFLYKTKDNRFRQHAWFDIGLGHSQFIGTNFPNWTDDRKRDWLRQQIWAILAHEYAHVFQLQIVSPTYPSRWLKEYTGIGEESPTFISPWWMEQKAYLLPDFMGLGLDGFNLISEITTAIDNIKIPSQTETDFLNRMMYMTKAGRNTKPEWGHLMTVYMAKLTSWKNVLVDWYYDFQRVKSDTPAYNARTGETELIPNTDNVFLHHYGKTEENLLKDVFTKVRNNVITLNYLSNVLPGGADFGIPNLVPFTI